MIPWAVGARQRRPAPTPSQIKTGIGGGPCPTGAAPPYHPAVIAGGVNSNVNSYTPYFIHISRQDTEQELTSYSLVLPKGITGKLAGIPFCPEADIEAARHAAGLRGGGQPLLPGGEPGRPHPDRLRRRQRPHLRHRQGLPGRPLPRRAALAGDDQLGDGRPLRPRHDRDPLGLPGRPAHRPAADRLHAPPTRSPTSSAASPCTCATSASTWTAPNSPTTPPAARPPNWSRPWAAPGADFDNPADDTTATRRLLLPAAELPHAPLQAETRRPPAGRDQAPRLPAADGDLRRARARGTRTSRKSR